MQRFAKNNALVGFFSLQKHLIFRNKRFNISKQIIGILQSSSVADNNKIYDTFINKNMGVFLKVDQTTLSSSPIVKYPNLHVLKDIVKNNQVFLLGEHHEESDVIKFQQNVLQAAVEETKSNTKTTKSNTNTSQNTTVGSVYLFLEHFNIDQQSLLDDYLETKNNITEATNELIEKYISNGEEGFDLKLYVPLLKYAKLNGVKIRGGFLPRKYAKLALANRQDLYSKEAYQFCIEKKYLDHENDILYGSEEHYIWFQTLINGAELK